MKEVINDIFRLLVYLACSCSTAKKCLYELWSIAALFGYDEKSNSIFFQSTLASELKDLCPQARLVRTLRLHRPFMSQGHRLAYCLCTFKF